MHICFQDLVQLVNADQPYWLMGITEMTRTFGLELLESVLTNFSSVFFKVSRSINLQRIYLWKGEKESQRVRMRVRVRVRVRVRMRVRERVRARKFKKL